MHTTPGGTEPSGHLGGGWTVEPESPGKPSDVHDTAQQTAEPAENPVADASATDAGAPPQVSNAAIVMLGVFGGLFLLYTWGWFIVARAYSIVNAATAEGSGLIGGVFQQIVFWAAPFAPLTWFLASVVLARKRPKVLAILLVIGAVLLLPLPMIGGAA